MPHAVPDFVWVLTVVVLITEIAFDLLVIARRQREVTTRERAALDRRVYVGLAGLIYTGVAGAGASS